jgi:hypothetical protein
VPVLVTVSVPSVVWPLMAKLLRPVTVSEAPLPSTALPVMVSDLPAPSTVPWVTTVLPVSSGVLGQGQGAAIGLRACAAHRARAQRGWPLMAKLLKPVTVSPAAVAQHRVAGDGERLARTRATVPWVVTVLPVSVVFSLRVSAPP